MIWPKSVIEKAALALNPEGSIAATTAALAVLDAIGPDVEELLHSLGKILDGIGFDWTDHRVMSKWSTQ